MHKTLKLRWSLCVAISCVALSGCEFETPEEFRSEEGNFRVMMPGKPELKTQTLPSPVGALELSIYMHETPAHNVYWVGYTDYPVGALKRRTIEMVLDGAVSGSEASSGWRVSKQRPVRLGQHLGREATVEVPPQGNLGKGIGRMRVFLVGSRLFQIAAVGPASSVSVASLEKYVRSFKLLHDVPPADLAAAPAAPPAPRPSPAPAPAPAPPRAQPAITAPQVVQNDEPIPEPPAPPAEFFSASAATTPTTETVAGASVASFAWVDQNEDRVGSGGNPRPDGQKDHHFRLALVLPGNAFVEEIVITSGSLLHWTTAPSNQYWHLATFENGREINRKPVDRVGRFSGPHTLDLYMNDGGGTGPGTRFDLELILTIDGKLVTLQSHCKRP